MSIDKKKGRSASKLLPLSGLPRGQTILLDAMRTFQPSFILLLLILAPASLWSASLTWYLKDVNLTGGGSLSGSLTYDHDTGVLSSWFIQSSPGAPEILCPANGCTWTSSTDANTVFGIGVVADTPAFTSFALGTINGESLLIALAGQLTDAGGTVPMVGLSPNGCHEGNPADPGCVLNGNGPSGADLSGSLTTAPTVPVVESAALPTGIVGSSYTQSLTASGGTPPYSRWTISSGTMPPGLALNASTGLISGVPTTAGNYSFSVTVQDSTGAISVPQSFSVVIMTANVIVSQEGVTNPVSNGFTLNVGGGVTSQGPVGTNAWGVQGDWCCSENWYYLSGSQITALTNATNWAFIVTYQNLSSDTGPGYFGWACGYGSVAFVQVNGVRFDLDLHSDGHGNQVLCADPISGSPNYTIQGLGTNYVTLELLYNNSTNTANILVNGVQVISNYAGFPNLPQYPESIVAFGGENGVFSLVELETNVGTSETSPTTGSDFVSVAPCRVVDTRNPVGPFGGPSIAGNSSRAFVIPSGPCGIPATATAYSLNVTVVPQGPLGYLTIWPNGQSQPVVSTLNSDGRIKANAAIVPAGSSGAVSVYVTNTTDVVLDINGYFAPENSPGALSLYTLTPCRIADTRNPAGVLGGPSLVAGVVRSFPILSSACDVSTTAQAYSLNFTAVPPAALGYLSVWPAGQSQPLVSSLNDPTGTIAANAVIVPAGASGALDVFSTDQTNLVIDANGYFAPPASGGLALYPMQPCRVLDTRQSPGTPISSLTFSVQVSPCTVPSTAQAYVFNATVVPNGSLGYITLWPEGQAQPLVSTLNAIDGAITSNLAIVPTTNGSISIFASNPTHLILDISGYFAP